VGITELDQDGGSRDGNDADHHGYYDSHGIFLHMDVISPGLTVRQALIFPSKLL
jgi:hypothetical protein